MSTPEQQRAAEAPDSADRQAPAAPPQHGRTMSESQAAAAATFKVIAGPAATIQAPQRGGRGGVPKKIPKWVPDGEYKSCMVCDKAFTLRTRRHHCRDCGRLVCDQCSPHRVVLPYAHSQKPQRVCSECFPRWRDTPFAAASGPLQQAPSTPTGASTASVTSKSAGAQGAGVPSLQQSFIGASAPQAIRQPAAARTPLASSSVSSSSYSPSSSAASTLPISATLPSPAAAAAAAALEDPRMRPVANVPAWTYAFKPFTEKGQDVGIGRLLVRVVAADNLPPMNLFNSCDPYCVVRLAGQEVKTRAATRTLTPLWNEEFILEVTNATSNLKLALYDHEVALQDKLIAEASIPLAELSHQQKHYRVVELKLADSLLKTEAGKKADRRIREAAKDGQSLTPKLYLEVQYIFSKMGEFFSHFSPENEPPAPPPEFSVEIMYGHFWRLLSLISPIIAFFTSAVGILSWQQPYQSLLALALYIYVALNPWVLIVIVQLLIIRYIVWQYVYRVWEKSIMDEKQRAKEAHDKQLEEDARRSNIIFRVGKGALAGTRAVLSYVPLLPFGKEGPLNENEEARFNSVIRTMANTSLAAAGMTKDLGYYQDSLGWTNDMIQTIYDLFQWRNPGVTKAILLTLCATTVYSLFFPHLYLWLLLGGYVLTCMTVPGRAFMWVVLGVVRYLSRTKADQKALQAIATATAQAQARPSSAASPGAPRVTADNEPASA